MNDMSEESENQDVLVDSDADQMLMVVSPRQQIRQMSDIKLLTRDELAFLKFIHPSMENANIFNSFRALRTKLFQKSKSTNFSVMVTSIVPEGGATYLSTNLATAISLDFEKTAILLDCNSPGHRNNHFSYLNSIIGLTDFLDDPSIDAKEIINATGIPRLRYIPPGRPKESIELIGSSRMHELLEELITRYKERYIVIDAPPITNSTDARLTAELCDYVILAVPYGKVTKGQIESAISTIPPEKFVGIVFNN